MKVLKYAMKYFNSFCFFLSSELFLTLSPLFPQNIHNIKHLDKEATFIKTNLPAISAMIGVTKEMRIKLFVKKREWIIFFR